jgi:hypothetical protein
VTASAPSIKFLDYNATTNTPWLELSNCNVFQVCHHLGFLTTTSLLQMDKKKVQKFSWHTKM